eukprot:GFUD01024848.1.p1 GENE.GFUD01024848.1~~GFUD01024848.1.p1  ORF type:complete len:181 (+),score=52.32 GFUD01024848.1:74-616(+)
MGRIIHCSDLVIKIEDYVEISNITEWILESTDFRPVNPDTCEVRDELDRYEKLWVILMIWLFLVIISIFYCYFCEQRLFSSQKLFDKSLVDQQGLVSGRCPNQECNVRNTRFTPGPKRLDLSKFRSSCLQGPDQRSSTSSTHLLSDMDCSQNCNPGYGAPALGQFRILSENENLLKKRTL